jgi:hypothetical protein
MKVSTSLPASSASACAAMNVAVSTQIAQRRAIGCPTRRRTQQPLCQRDPPVDYRRTPASSRPSRIETRDEGVLGRPSSLRADRAPPGEPRRVKVDQPAAATSLGTQFVGRFPVGSRRSSASPRWCAAFPSRRLAMNALRVVRLARRRELVEAAVAVLAQPRHALGIELLPQPGDWQRQAAYAGLRATKTYRIHPFPHRHAP